MSDKGRIYAGIVVFLVLVLFPIWYNLAMGKSGFRPEIVKPASGKCVLDTAYMRTSHMNLLNTWRDDYVRQNSKVHLAPDGKRYTKSLSNTCLDCHNNKAEFCDRCHDYTGVDPYCWDCHVERRTGGSPRGQ
jgi:hypothetical protein